MRAFEAGDTASSRDSVTRSAPSEQHVGDQPQPGLVPLGTFALEEGGHLLQRGLPLRQQRLQAGVELRLCAVEGRHRVEARLRVQREVGQQCAPLRFARQRVAHEVQHRQHRLAAGREDLHLAAELGDHRLAAIDDEQCGVDVQQRAQHLRLLLEILARGAGLEKGADALRRRHVGAQRAERGEQAGRVFQARRVEEAQRARPSMHRSTDSTWRVVPGRSDTSPKSRRRVSVRSSEVLPALVWPTTAMASGLAMAVPASRRVGVGEHRQVDAVVRVEPGAPSGQRLRGQFGGHEQQRGGHGPRAVEEAAGAAVRRRCGMADHQQPRRRRRGQPLQQRRAFLAAALDAFAPRRLGEQRGRQRPPAAAQSRSARAGRRQPAGRASRRAAGAACSASITCVGARASKRLINVR
jgi:hypothetical protein